MRKYIEWKDWIHEIVISWSKVKVKVSMSIGREKIVFVNADSSGERGSANSDTCGQGGGVENGQKIANVLYGCP